MWNYIFFIAYLESKPKNQYTGVETYIEKKIKNFDYSWFPINR